MTISSLLERRKEWLIAKSHFAYEDTLVKRWRRVYDSSGLEDECTWCTSLDQYATNIRLVLVGYDEDKFEKYLSLVKNNQELVKESSDQRFDGKEFRGFLD